MPADAPAAASASRAIRAALDADLPEEAWATVAALVGAIDEASAAGDDDSVRRLTAELEAVVRPPTPAPPAAPAPAPAPARRSRRVALVAVLAAVALGVLAWVVLGGSEGADTDDEDDDQFADTTIEQTTTTFFDDPVETTVPTTGPGQVETLPAVVLADDGALELELRWSSAADLDLAVVEPDGTVVDVTSGPSTSGGTHEGDANFECVDNGATERITWAADAPAGFYEILVFGFQVEACGPGDYSVIVRAGNATTSSTGSVTDDEEDVFELDVAGDEPPATTAPATTEDTTPPTTEQPAAGGSDDDEGDGDDLAVPAFLALAAAGALGALALTRAVDGLWRGGSPAALATAPALRPVSVSRPRLPAPAELRELANHTIHRLDMAQS